MEAITKFKGKLNDSSNMTYFFADYIQYGKEKMQEIYKDEISQYPEIASVIFTLTIEDAIKSIWIFKGLESHFTDK